MWHDCMHYRNYWVNVYKYLVFSQDGNIRWTFTEHVEALKILASSPLCMRYLICQPLLLSNKSCRQLVFKNLLHCQMFLSSGGQNVFKQMIYTILEPRQFAENRLFARCGDRVRSGIAQGNSTCCGIGDCDWLKPMGQRKSGIVSNCCMSAHYGRVTSHLKKKKKQKNAVCKLKDRESIWRANTAHRD